jgi:hypothetical protein
MIPFVPIIESGQKSFSMFEGIQTKYDWVCDTVEYPSAKALVRDLDRQIIAPVLDMEAKIAEKRARSRAVRRISEMRSFCIPGPGFLPHRDHGRLPLTGSENDINRGIWNPFSEFRWVRSIRKLVLRLAVHKRRSRR